MSQKPSMSHSPYESAVMDATSKEASLPVAAGGGTDHGLPYGFLDHRHQHDPWWRQGSQPSTGLPLATPTTDISIASGSNVVLILFKSPIYSNLSNWM